MTEIHEEELTCIVEGTGITFVGKILGQAIQYLYAIIIARMLGGRSFGLLMLGLAIFNLSGVLCRLGLDGGVIRYISIYNGIGDKERIKGVIVQSLKYSFIISMLVSIILFLTAKPIFATFFDKPELGGIIKVLSISLPFLSLMTLALVATQGFKIMKYTVYGQHLFLPLSNLSLAVIFFSIGFELYGILTAHVISIFFASIVSICLLIKTFPPIMHTQAVPETKKLLRFSIPLLLALFLNLLIRWTDTLMLGYFRSPEEVGIYNAAMRTAWLTSVILVSSHAIFAPIISELHHKKEIKKLENLFKTVTKWTYTISCPMFFLVVFLSKEIMSVFGQEFVAGWGSLIILAFALLVNSSAGAVGLLLTMSGKQDLIMYDSIGICLLNIVLNYLLISPYGILGAAIASGISLIVFNLLVLLQVRILLRIHPFSRKFLNPTLFTITAYAIALLVRPLSTNWTSTQKSFISVPLFLFVFITLMYKCGLDSEDVFIFNTFKGKLQKKEFGYKNQVKQEK